MIIFLKNLVKVLLHEKNDALKMLAPHFYVPAAYMC